MKERKDPGKRFRRTLKSFMEGLGVTQKKLGKICGVSQVSISQFLRGPRLPSVPVLERMARGLKISMDELWKGGGR